MWAGLRVGAYVLAAIWTRLNHRANFGHFALPPGNDKMINRQSRAKSFLIAG